MAVTPHGLRLLADGVANQNAYAESVAARYAASEDLREALRDLLALHQAHHNHPTHAAARKALAKAERPEP